MSDHDFSEDDPKPDWRYEPKHANYARPSGKPRALGAGPKRHVLTIARADRRLADAAPEVQPTRITGRYQNAGAAGESDRPALLLHVNQAGKHIQALLVDLSHQGGPPKYYRFWGDLRGAKFEILDGDLNGGSLTIDGDGMDLLVTYEAVPLNSERFHLRELRPSFLDDSLEPLIELYGDVGGNVQAAKKMLEESERTPLTDAQMKSLSDAFSFQQMEPFLKKYHEYAKSTLTADRAQAIFTACNLDDYIGKVLKGNGWHRQLETAREYTRRTLAFQKVSFDQSRKSLLQWIEDLTVEAIGFLPDIGSSTEVRPMTNLRGLIGIGAAGDLRRYKYTVTLDLKHKGFNAWGNAKAELYYGTMNVRADTAHSFSGITHTYNVVLVGGGLLLSKGKGGESSIKAYTSFDAFGEWTPADFPGTLKLVEGGVWLGEEIVGKKIGGGKRDAALVLSGRGNHPEIVAALEGLDSFRDGIGAEFQFSVGQVLQKGEDLESKDFSREKKRVDYTLSKKDKHEAHFDLGSALLRGRGRQAVRVCAATWLPWLDSKQSALNIIGHADTVDEHKPGRNLELSILRADNVKQAMIDILGEDLGMPDQQIHASGLGDAEAAAEYHLREVPDDKYRRVDIWLNGRCVLVLWSA